MLGDTLAVWDGEFVGIRMMQNKVHEELSKEHIGRDDHLHAYSMWLADGSTTGGMSYGQTDEFGYYPAENLLSVRDLQATILHQLGVDQFQLRLPYQGLDQSLMDPSHQPKAFKVFLVQAEGNSSLRRQRHVR